MTEMQKSMAIFSGSVSPELADKIADQLGVDLGSVKLEKFLKSMRAILRACAVRMCF